LDKKVKSSVLTRVTLVFFITLLFIYCVIVWLLIGNMNATKNDFLETRFAQARAYIDDFEFQLKTLYMHESQLLNNQAVRKIAYSAFESDYDKYQAVLLILRELHDIDSFSPFIEEVTIIFPLHSLKLSSVSGYNKGISIEPDEFSDSLAEGYFVRKNGRLFTRISYPLLYPLGGSYLPDMIVTVYLSEPEIMRSLEAFSDSSGDSAALVQGDSVLVGNKDDVILSNFSNISAEKLSQQIKSVNGTYRIDRISSSSYPVHVLLSTNSKTLTQFARNGILLLTMITLIASVIFLISIYLTREIIRKPLNEMIIAFEKLQEGDFKVRIRHKPHDEFNILYACFNNTVENLKQLIDRGLEQDKLINAAELAQLQSQINPHFLHNSFFIISRMAQNEEYEPIVAFVTALAKYYCFINKTQQKAIPLKDEVEHMINYIDIQQMRFGDRVRIEREECPRLLEKFLVPKLILQPIIENAYEYGVNDKLDNGLIRVSYLCDDNWFDINIEDNGDCSDEVIEQASEKLSSINESEKSHALYNINRRLKLHFGSESGIFIERGSMNGFKVSLHIVYLH